MLVIHGVFIGFLKLSQQNANFYGNWERETVPNVHFVGYRKFPCLDTLKYPRVGKSLQKWDFIGNVKTIYSNSHFSKLGITMGFPIKTQSNLKWEFKNNPNFYLVLNFLEYFQLSQWRKLWVSSKRIF